MSNNQDRRKSYKQKIAMKRYMDRYDELKNIYMQKAAYLDTQNDIMYLQRDKGFKFFNVDPFKVDHKLNLIKRKLLYGELDDRNDISIYTYLLITLFILIVISLTMLYNKMKR